MLSTPDSLTVDAALATRLARQTATSQTVVSLCLIGGRRIIRAALSRLLETDHTHVAGSFEDEEALATAMTAQPQSEPIGLILMILAGGSFQTFHRISDLQARIPNLPPLAVLSDKVSRGQVYAALKVGAKAYVHLDADPEELLRAIRLAAEGKMHLSSDAAQLLVNDISTAHEPSHGPRKPNPDLSPREVEVVQLLCDGLSSKQIARRMHIAAKTVENHRYNIYRKCEVDSIAGLIRHAIQHGMVSI